MYGPPSSFRPRGGRGPQIASLADFLPENLNYSPYPSSSNSSYWQGANPNFQNPSFHPSQVPHKRDYRDQPQRFTVDFVESAVSKAHKDLLDAGENVSVWKICQSVARSLNASSWDALRFRTVDVPTLRELQFVEGKVNTFIHCFVNTRKMTSVHELELDICKSEGVGKFEELRIGPLLRHPLVRDYFSVPPDAKEICEITTEELVSRLSTFLNTKNMKEVKLEEFLDFLVLKCSVASREHLGVRIRSMGLFIKYIRAGRRAENAAAKSIQERRLPKEEVEIYSGRRELSSLMDDERNDHCEDSGPLDDCNIESHSNDANSSGKELHIVTHVDDDAIMAGNEKKLNRLGATKVTSFDLTDKEIEIFVTTWEDACKKYSADEVISMMIDNYSDGLSHKKKKKVRNSFSSYLSIGLLNVVVS